MRLVELSILILSSAVVPAAVAEVEARLARIKIAIRASSQEVLEFVATR